MLHTLVKPVFGIACVLAVTSGGQAGELFTPAVPMTPIVYSPDGRLVAPPADRPDITRVAGAECPNGSGSYCSDEYPYCCPGVNVAAYCAKDVNGCTE